MASICRNNIVDAQIPSAKNIEDAEALERAKIRQSILIEEKEQQASHTE